ncbi:TetR/AcrR family transcriptional regulator [Amycolatopsis halotolerans]|uniref:TetR/AcrR family transcriptional regulator n=1 Tax=Amycolatopsis halotolerans TaxID=330083 RepID=A0ABV7QPB9_9PSEU
MAGKRDRILRAAVGMIARNGVRGLRVEEVAAEAGASTGLIYYHFKDRAGLLRATLDHVNDRAERYTAQEVPDSADARAVLEQTLLLELQDTAEVRENSTAWGELRASAVFEDDLRERLAEATRLWVAEIAELVEAARSADVVTPGGLSEPAELVEAARSADVVTPGGPSEPADVAERLTALVEGLSERWLSGTLDLQRARALVRGAIVAELG